MMYCRNFCSILLIVFLGISLLGCGAEVPSEPGEEVVSDKWVDPKDIGKEYRVNVEDIKLGDTVLLSDGETYTIGILDTIEPADDGTAVLHTYTAEPVPNKPDTWHAVPIEKTIVLEGDPIVSLWAGELVPYFDEEFGRERFKGVDLPLTKDNNVKDEWGFASVSVRVDRTLDYNLPIYFEYRTQDLKALGSQVRVIRFIGVMRKDLSREAYMLFGDEKITFSVGDRNEHQKAYLSILPYTEMKKIDLPATTGFPEEDPLSPLDISIIPEGHTFRPYRISSPSFMMMKPEIEDNW